MEKNDKTIWIIRHGETELNATNKIQGQKMNASLNDVGIKQRDQFYTFSQSFNFDLVVYSPLVRSQQTIQPFLIHGTQGIESKEIIEISWGRIEGNVNTGDTLEQYLAVNKAWDDGDLDAKIVGGESIQEVATRCMNFLSWLKNIQRQNILICTHGRTIRILVCLLEGQPLTNMKLYGHSNLGIYRYHLNQGHWKGDMFNDVSHLDEHKY